MASIAQMIALIVSIASIASKVPCRRVAVPSPSLCLGAVPRATRVPRRRRTAPRVLRWPCASPVAVGPVVAAHCRAPCQWSQVVRHRGLGPSWAGSLSPRTTPSSSTGRPRLLTTRAAPAPPPSPCRAAFRQGLPVTLPRAPPPRSCRPVERRCPPRLPVP